MKVAGIRGPIWRLGLVFVVAIVVLLAVRARFVPPTFGDIGHYRADSLVEEAAQPVRYAGLQACAECHVDVAEVKAASYHHGLTCEGCHGPAQAHAEDPTSALPQVPTGRVACLRCHSYLASRPTGFPQIIERLHNPLKPCAECHDPHDPTPPEIPSNCSACHAAIARTKAVSHHWALECETCHEVPAGHRENPRANLPKKPSDRAFCGRCHYPGAAGPPEAARVDPESHGERNLCWQCHYPHHPESG